MKVLALVLALALPALAEDDAPRAMTVRSGFIVEPDGKTHDIAGGSYLPSPVAQEQAKRIKRCEASEATLKTGPSAGDVVTLSALLAVVAVAAFGVGRATR